MAILIKTDGTKTGVEPKNGKYFTLDELREFVDGHIERIRIPGGKVMIINEEGKLYGLPFNKEATEVSGLAGHDVVVGDVLICRESGEHFV